MTERFRKEHRRNWNFRWYRQNIIVFFVAFFLISLLSVVYAALSQRLDIGGGIVVRADKDIRIIDIVAGSDDCGYDIYNPKYVDDSITVNFKLPLLECTIEYDVTIRNKGSADMEITGIIEENYNNEDIVYIVDGISVGDIISSGEDITFTIRFRYNPDLAVLPENTELGAIIKIQWEIHTKPPLLVIDFLYKGAVEEYIIPESGYYVLEAWGAQGGSIRNFVGGRGAYTSGVIYFNANEKIYVYVGGMPGSDRFGGYNGATDIGANFNNLGRPGGGATDIRLQGGHWHTDDGFRSRIMIAAGGGGANDSNGGYTPTTCPCGYSNACGYGQGSGGDGGELYSKDAESINHVFNGCSENEYDIATGASQKAGGQSLKYNYIGPTFFDTGSFGVSIWNNHAIYLSTTGAGGGYYTGAIANNAGGSGGSSYISGYAGVNSVQSISSTDHTLNTCHYSGKYFTNGKMMGGVHFGHGKARLSYLGQAAPVKTNKKFDNVRYVKSCMGTNNIDNEKRWVEIQAIYNGNNVAKGKSLIGNVTNSSRIVDGDIDSAIYASSTTYGTQCVTVDLGSQYNLDEIVLWSYWQDNRKNNDNILSVSSDNANWVDLHNYSSSSGYAETSQGMRYRAWN